MSHSSFLHPYFGVFVLFLGTFVAFSFTLFLQRFISNKIASRRREKLKLSPYECGVIANKQPNKISSRYYVMALLFILFDVEIIFMFPWAVDFRALGAFGFVEMLIFVFLLLLGFAYAWRKGALSWQSMD